MAVKKSRKRSGFVIYSYLGYSAVTVARKDGKVLSWFVRKGYHYFVNRGYMKGVSFLSKLVYRVHQRTPPPPSPPPPPSEWKLKFR